MRRTLSISAAPLFFASTLSGGVPGAAAATLYLECGDFYRITIDTDTGLIAVFDPQGRRRDRRAEISSHTIQWEHTLQDRLGGMTTHKSSIDIAADWKRAALLTGRTGTPTR